MTELEGKYRIIRSLGTGAGGETFEAEDLRDGTRVALKRLVLANASDWKRVDLFEREARVLAGLNHPAIPRYRDSFVMETGQGSVSYLVHDFAPGQSLRGWVEQGWRADEAEVLRIGAFLLDVLSYLHALHPPILHRDVKPANVIRSEDGRLWLVDFGAVRDVTTTMSGGSTVVGTYGYMAPEQFRGHAVPASDIYGVGATLLYLLGGKPPTEYPQEKLKVAFRGQIRVSPFLARWLDRALEPAAEDRFADAAEARAVLRGEKRATPKPRPGQGSGARVAILGGILAVVLVGAGGFILHDLRSADRPVVAKNAPTPDNVPRLPQRIGGARIASDAHLFDGRHTHIIFDIGVSPDDKVVASSSDAVIKLWDAETGKELQSIGAHGGKVGAVYFFSDNKRLLSAGGRTLKTWEYATGKPLESFDVGSVVHPIAVSRDERLVFHGGPDGTVHVWDLAKGAPAANYPFGPAIYALALNADGTRLAVGGREGLVKIYAVPEGTVVTSWRPHTATVNDLEFARDGSVIASAGDDSRAAVTALSSAGQTRLDSEYRSKDEVWGVRLSPDGKLLATMSKDKTLAFVSLARRQKVQSELLGTMVSKAVFSRDGRRLWAGAGGMVASWTIAGRGWGTPFPQPRADVAEAPTPKDADHGRYLEILRLLHGGPRDDRALVREKIEDAARENPGSPYPRLAKTRLLLDLAYRSGDTYDPATVASARGPLREAEALGPKTVDYWTTKAFLERTAKDAPAAREALRQAFAIDPHDALATLSQARLDRAEGKRRAAAAALSELIRTTRRGDLLSELYEELAFVAKELGDLDLAEQCFKERIARAPGDAWARGNYAFFLNHVDEPDRAITEAQAALALADYPAAHGYLAHAHQLLGDRALWDHEDDGQAIREYDEAIRLDPEETYAYYGRAAAYRARAFDRKGGDNVAKARADLRKVIALAKPPWPDAEAAMRELDAIEERAKRK